MYKKIHLNLPTCLSQLNFFFFVKHKLIFIVLKFTEKIKFYNFNFNLKDSKNVSLLYNSKTKFYFSMRF